jgi:hypothetical protein
VEPAASILAIQDCHTFTLKMEAAGTNILEEPPSSIFCREDCHSSMLKMEAAGFSETLVSI